MDIEKMRAYRDAVRGDAGEGVVHYAAILYPGLETHYAQGLEALQAHPGREQTVEKQIAALPREALAP